jgi:hypothetical protein
MGNGQEKDLYQVRLITYNMWMILGIKSRDKQKSQSQDLY